MGAEGRSQRPGPAACSPRLTWGHDRLGIATARLATPTEREHEVAAAVGRGLSNAEVAHGLHLSVPTVKAHVSRVLEKLGATNRVQVVICMHDTGLA